MRGAGLRYASDMLPEDQLIRFFAWKLANGNVAEWQWLCDNLNQLELLEAFAMRRTSYYLSLAPDRD